MSHYFTNDENLRSQRRLVKYSINGKDFELESDIGVFSKNKLDYGSEVLIKSLLPIDLGNRLLDLGCGIGPIGLTLASFHPSTNVVCSDVNTRALELCKLNARVLTSEQTTFRLGLK